MVRKVGLVLLGTLAILLASVVTGAADSGGYRGPKRSGIYPETGLLKKWPEGGPKLLWSYDKLGLAWASVTVHGGRVYTLGGCRPGTAFCFSLDGDLLWRKEYGPDRPEGRFPGARSSIEIAAGKAIFATGDGVVYCLDAASGNTLWSVDTAKEFDNKVPGHGYNLTPLVYDGKVICPIRRGRHTHAALDAATGKTVWASEPSEYSIGDSSPVPVDLAGRRLIVDNLYYALVAFDPATGKIVWRSEGPTGGSFTPVFGEGRIFADMDRHRAALLEPTGDAEVFRKVWQLDAPLNPVSQAVILDGKVFFLGNVTEEVEQTVERKGKTTTRKVAQRHLALKAMDLKTGRLLNAAKVRQEGSMVAADGMIYLLTGGEHNWNKGTGPDTWISLIKPTADGFEVVSEFQPRRAKTEAWVNPSIAEGRLFHRQGTVLAVYDLRAKP